MTDDYRDPKYWTENDDGYFVVKGGEGNVVRAVKSLWEDSDGKPNKILCKKLTELIFIKAFIDYYEETNDADGLAWIERTVGGDVPSDVIDDFMNYKEFDRRGAKEGDYLPGDRVFFKNQEWSNRLHSPGYVEQHPEDWPNEADRQKEIERRQEKYYGEEGSNTIAIGKDATKGEMVMQLYRGSPDADLNVWSILEKQRAYGGWNSYKEAEAPKSILDFVIRGVYGPKTPVSGGGSE